MVPKPSKQAQTLELAARRVALSDVFAVRKRNRWLQRTWEKTDFIYAGFMVLMHGLALAAPFTFSWANVALFLGESCVVLLASCWACRCKPQPVIWECFALVSTSTAAGYSPALLEAKQRSPLQVTHAGTYAITGCLGITLSYHRQLSHRSFATPKWLEYTLAYCGVLAIQGDPVEWVSSHRYHHLHTDTPLDPHSPYEGFWWSHMGWLLDNKVRSWARQPQEALSVQAVQPRVPAATAL